MSVAEFIELREGIEALAGQITVFVKNKNVEDSRKRLDEANQKLDQLKTMVSTDVQVIVAERLTRQLTGLSEKLATVAAKKPVRKAAVRKKAAKKERRTRNVERFSSLRVYLSFSACRAVPWEDQGLIFFRALARASSAISVS